MEKWFKILTKRVCLQYVASCVVLALTFERIDDYKLDICSYQRKKISYKKLLSEKRKYGSSHIHFLKLTMRKSNPIWTIKIHLRFQFAMHCLNMFLQTLGIGEKLSTQFTFLLWIPSRSEFWFLVHVRYGMISKLG